MTVQEWQNFGWYLAVFLVPLFPAVLLYKTLPSLADVSGPFKGLNIKLTGAFAGYFLLVLLSCGFAYFVMTHEKQKYEVWEVSGVLGSLDTKGKPVNVIASTITLVPSESEIYSDGPFKVKIMVKPGHTEGAREFPQLHFFQHGYNKEVLPVTDEYAKIEEKKKKVIFRNEIKLKPLEERPSAPDWKRSN
jgi:hypothetical protein